MNIQDWKAYKEEDTLWIINEKEQIAYETTERQPAPNDIFICHDIRDRDWENINNLHNMMQVEVPSRFINKISSTNE